MTIPFSKYVRITSGVGASVGVRQRDLIGRLFTASAIVSPNAVLEFTDAASVGDYFGTTSGEYLRAAWYLSLIHISEPTRPRFGSRMPSSA